jgi:hypothetical protein
MPTEPVSPSQPFVTPADLQAATRGRIKESDPYALPALAAACKEIRNAVGWHISPIVLEEVTVSGAGGRTVLLPTLRLLDVISVTLRGATQPLVYEANYDWDTNGLLISSGYWPNRFRAITVVMEHGWDPEDIPEIRHLALTMAARAIIASRAMNIVQEGVGSNSVKFGTVGGSLIATEILPHEMAKLKPYMIPGRA